MLEASQANCGKLADRHEVEGFYINPQEVTTRVANLIDEHVRRIRNSTGTINGDFDDQIWLPWAFDIRPNYVYDTVLVDEAQDMNAAQFDLVLRLAGKTGRIIAVGDEKQAIYGFRGAGITSIQDLTSTLQATERGVQTLPLSVCYRCPTKVIELVNLTGYNTDIKAAPNAIEGEVKIDKVDNLTDYAKNQEEAAKLAVISSLNAPLVPSVLRFAANGIPAAIQGRDASKQIRNTLKKIQGRIGKSASTDKVTVPEFLKVAEQIKSEAIAKATARNEPTETILDIFDTLNAICDAPNCNTLADVIMWINKVFDPDVKGVTHSTVHRFKGQEREIVCIVRPDALPVFWAKQEWEVKQAENCAYVAFTRAQKKLVFMVDKDVGIHPHVAECLSKMGIRG